MRQINWFIVHLIFGLWLFVSPYVLNFTDLPGAYWNAVLLGLGFVFSATVGLYYAREEFPGDGLSHQRDRSRLPG
ncbi:MAG TPA: SPW repeat protein [Candidatus Binatia bacterium]